MKKALLVIIWGLCATALPAQDSSKEAMEKLAFLEGEWTGKAWVSMGPGQESNLDQHEKVQMKLNGNVLLIEGTGRENGNIVFQALGLMSFNVRKNEYQFKAFRDNGLATDAYLIVKGEKWLEWGFEIPNGGKIRYIIKINEKGQWHELGEYSPDGQRWFKSFEMTLDKL